MKTNKKQKMHTAYQIHLDLLRSAGILLIGLPIVSIVIIYFVLEDNNYKDIDLIYYILAASVFTIVLGIIVSVIASIKQNVADSINENLYAIWKYKPETIYRFYKKMCRYESKSVFYNFALIALATLVLSIIMLFNAVAKYLGIVFLCASAILFLYALYMHPYVQYLTLKLRTRLMGDAKEIIFSRSGIWYCGRVCFFGDNGITYHRVERKEIHGQDAIVFYYTKTRGFQQTPMELAIPVSPKMSYAAGDLVEEFNRSDLLTK